MCLRKAIGRLVGHNTDAMVLNNVACSQKIHLSIDSSSQGVLAKFGGPKVF